MRVGTGVHAGHVVRAAPHDCMLDSRLLPALIAFAVICLKLGSQKQKQEVSWDPRPVRLCGRGLPSGRGA
eukprot:5801467-Alexandrium_andersonii.AAC.1